MALRSLAFADICHPPLHGLVSLKRDWGYFGSRADGAGAKGAIKVFKIALQRLLSSNVFKISELKSNSGVLAYSSDHTIPKAHLVAVDNSSVSPEVSSVELSLDLSRVLACLEIELSDTSNKEILELKAFHALLQIQLRNIPDLVSNQSDEAVRIKASMEWCFDSYCSLDPTISFLQVCIGLEALFGEANQTELLTRMLSDRCAYLVGRSHESRGIIRENFKKLYEVRSKIVHGVTTSLDSDQVSYLDWGRNILEASILKELNLMYPIKSRAE